MASRSPMGLKWQVCMPMGVVMSNQMGAIISTQTDVVLPRNCSSCATSVSGANPSGWSAQRRCWCDSQVAAALAERKRKEPSPAGSAYLDVLRTLAREIGLVAVAAQDGCLCHVVGRAHHPCASSLLRPGLCWSWMTPGKPLCHAISSACRIATANARACGLLLLLSM